MDAPRRPRASAASTTASPREVALGRRRRRRSRTPRRRHATWQRVAVGVGVDGDGRRCRARAACGRSGSAISPRFATSTLREGAARPRILPVDDLADQLTVARAASVPVVVLLFALDFHGHNYWATASSSSRWRPTGSTAGSRGAAGRTSALGSLLDPIADKLLVLASLIVLIDQDVFPAWMVAAIVAREFLVSGLRLAAIERGVVIAGARPRQAEDVVAGGRGRRSAASPPPARGSTTVAWWALLVALVLTWVSGLDYARVAPRLLRGGAVAS